MKRTSAGVYPGGSISASASGVSVRVGSPGAPGWTMFGAVSARLRVVVAAAAAAGEHEQEPEDERHSRLPVDPHHHAILVSLNLSNARKDGSMTEDAAPSSTRRRALRAMLGALFSRRAASSRQSQPPSRPPTRGSASPGFEAPGVAANGLELLANRTKPAGFFDPANPGSFAFVNSDLAFQGDHAFVGNFNGFLIYNISDPANPTIRTAVVCPGGQGEVSVYGNLLFMSAEETRPRTDCGAPGPDRRPAALPRRPDLRHLEPRRARPGRDGADVSRLAHAHAAEEPERRRTSTSTCPGRAAFAPRPRWRAAVHAGASSTNSSFTRGSK